MLIALLALLGVNLVLVVLLAGLVLSRKRWVAHQPGAFRCAVRLAEGQADGLGPTWRRGYGRWVRDVLVWSKAPFLFRNELVAIDALEDQRAARPDEVKRLGKQPVVARLRAGEAVVEVAVRAEDTDLARGAFHPAADAPTSTPTLRSGE